MNNEFDTLLKQRHYEPPSEDLEARILSAARFRKQETAAANDNQPMPLRNIAAIAAVLLIALSTAMIWNDNMTTPDETPATTLAEIEQPKGSENVALAEAEEKNSTDQEGVVGYLDWVYEEDETETHYFNYGFDI